MAWSEIGVRWPANVLNSVFTPALLYEEAVASVVLMCCDEYGLNMTAYVCEQAPSVRVCFPPPS
jgi:hypothetical protein